MSPHNHNSPVLDSSIFAHQKFDCRNPAKKYYHAVFKMSNKELLDRFHRRPALYVIGGDPRSEDWRGVWKIGTSASIPFRKNNWKTCSRYPVYFKHIFFLKASSLPEGTTLYELDSKAFPEWLKQHDELVTMHVDDGGGEEFFRFPDPVAVLREFLADWGVEIEEELKTDPFPFPFPHMKDHAKDLEAENEGKEAAAKSTNSHKIAQMLLKRQFLRALRLPALRTHQEELWECWSTTLHTEMSYKGYVQWPTGTGKTVGMLILILLLHTQMRKQGVCYRGLLVAPQNSILNTLMKHIRMIERWGIRVLEAHDAKFSGVSVPTDKPFLLVTTHAAIAKPEAFNKFPTLSHIHYDEVHRITGDTFYKEMLQRIDAWRIPFVTGTSATPKTSDPEQHAKIADLFGENAKPLHCVSVERAVKEGWIAPPHFKVVTLEGPPIPGFIYEIKSLLETQKFRNAKVIVYFEDIAQVLQGLVCAAATWTAEWRLFKAVSETCAGVETATDAAFVVSEATGTPQVLFACQKYREGSDIPGVDAVAFLMGRTSSAHIIEQVVGRAMRMEYEGKKATCLLARPRFGGEDEDAVLESVKLTLDRMYPGVKSIYIPTTHSSKESTSILWSIEWKTEGTWLSADESLMRVQNWYLRKSLRESVSEIQELCRSRGIRTSEEYHTLRKTVTSLPESPITLCNNLSLWYEFLNGEERPIPMSDFQALTNSLSIRTHEAWSKVHKDYPTMPSPQQLMDGYYKGREFVAASMRGRR